LFAAEVEVSLQHFVDDVLVADGGAHDFSSGFLDRGVDAGVAHDGGDERVVGEGSLREHFERGDDHDVVAVDQGAFLVAELDAVGVTVVGDADVGAEFADFRAEKLRVHGAALLVDVGAVGLVAVDEDLGTEFAKDAGGGLVGGAVGAIDDDAHAFERERAGQGGLGELDVTAEGVLDADGFADGFGGGRMVSISPLKTSCSIWPRCVVEFVAVGAEEFDAVVGVRIVGGGDDDAGIRAEAAGDVGDAGGGQGADEETSTPMERTPEEMAFSSM
jgi:hypothetical protein